MLLNATLEVLLEARRYQLGELEHRAIDETKLQATWQQAFADFAQDDSLEQFAYLDDKQPVGYLRVQLTARPEVHGAYIDEFNVLAPSRGSGYGRQLIEAGIAWVQARGAKTLQLEVARSNVLAMRLYERCGFTPADTNYLDYTFKIET